MKSTRSICSTVAVVLAACLSSGCNRPATETDNSGNSTVTNGISTTASNAWQDAKETGSNLWQQTKESFAAGVLTNEVSTNYFGFDYSRKDAFLADAKSGLDALDQSASSLSNRLATASDSTKAELQQTLQDIKAQREELGRKYHDMENATQDNWNDAKADFVKSYHDLKADLKTGWDTITSKL